MNDASSATNRRILVVDDMPAIHRVIAKILAPGHRTPAHEEELLFGMPIRAPESGFEVEFALTGERALDLVRRRVAVREPFAAAFVDMRMPTGWDGVETIEQLLRVQPDLEIAVCSAYADYSWHEVIARVGRPGLRLVQKPFAASDILEAAFDLTKRYRDQARLRQATRLTRRAC